MKVSQISDISAGYQFRGRVQPDAAGNVAVLQVKDLKGDGLHNSIDRASLATVTFEKDPSRYLLSSGDVLFLSRGSRVFATAFKDVPPNVIIPNYFYRLRPKRADSAATTVLPEYLAWYLNSPKAQAQLRLVHAGSHMPVVSMNDFLDLTIDVPPLSVQQSIVAVAALAQREQQLLRELLNLKKQLIDHVCDMAVSKQSERKKTR